MGMSFMNSSPFNGVGPLEKKITQNADSIFCFWWLHGALPFSIYKTYQIISLQID